MEHSDLIESLHGKWWFEHQSPMTCLIGSDGVGHDFVHPVDKLQAACRNSMAMIHAVHGYEIELQRKLVKRRILNRKIDAFKDAEILSPDAEDNLELLMIDLEELEMDIRKTELTLKDRVVSRDVFVNHAKELFEKVKSQYANYDEALRDIWISRVAYQAMCKNHPLGQELKVSLLTEEQKQEALKMMAFPENFPAPNANIINEMLSMEADNGKELGS